MNRIIVGLMLVASCAFGQYVPPYYAPVAGVFSNVVLDGFVGMASYTNLNGNVNPAIVYTNGIDDYYEIIITAQAEAPDNGTTLYVGASLNGIVSNGDIMAGYIKTGGDKINLSVNTCHMLTNGAVVQLICGSSAGTDGKVVTFDRLNTSIKRLR